jgi:hypothetical protein
LAEAFDVSLSGIPDQPVRAALTAQIEGGGAQPSRRQIADGLEIFFDALIAALQQDDGAFFGPAAGRKARIADLPPLALSGTGLSVV